MIPLLELILYFNGQLQNNPPEPRYNRFEIADSTLAYLNLYRQTQEALNNLGLQCNRILNAMKEH